MDRYDVVIVGGGIAGSALGAVLAPAGLDVLVLERQTVYRDKVRGEYMHPWGVAEARKLGLEEALLAAGGGLQPEPRLVLRGDRPGGWRSLVRYRCRCSCPGSPGRCASAIPRRRRRSTCSPANAARWWCAASATSRSTDSGSAPIVRYEYNGDLVEVACRLVVGADGRQSTVRRALGIELDKVESKATLGGLLVRADWTDDASFVGSEGDQYYLGFPRPNGYVRLYRACAPSDETAGPDRAQRMLDAFRSTSLPDSDRLAAGEAGRAVFVLHRERFVDAEPARRRCGAGWRCRWLERSDHRRRPERGDARRPFGRRRPPRRRRLVDRGVRAVCHRTGRADETSADVAHVTTTNRCTFTDAGVAQRQSVRRPDERPIH